MKNYYIKSGFIQTLPSVGAVSINDEITKVLVKNGYPATDCCNTVGLKDLNFPDDTTAALNNVALYSMYHTNGVVKIRLV